MDCIEVIEYIMRELRNAHELGAYSPEQEMKAE